VLAVALACWLAERCPTWEPGAIGTSAAYNRRHGVPIRPSFSNPPSGLYIRRSRNGSGCALCERAAVPQWWPLTSADAA
jgi:hypothetical protein